MVIDVTSRLRHDVISRHTISWCSDSCSDATCSGRVDVAAVFMDDTCFTPTDAAGPPRRSAGCYIRPGRGPRPTGCASRVGRVGARPGPDTCVSARVVGYAGLYAGYSDLLLVNHRHAAPAVDWRRPAAAAVQGGRSAAAAAAAAGCWCLQQQRRRWRRHRWVTHRSSPS